MSIILNCLHFLSRELLLLKQVLTRLHPDERGEYVERERFWHELWLNSALFVVLNIDISKPWMFQDLICTALGAKTLLWVLSQQLSNQILKLIAIGNACFVW